MRVKQFKSNLFKYLKNNLKEQPPRTFYECLLYTFYFSQNLFDYEVDSDDEWEEEEPGESLKGSDDEKDEENPEENEYDVDNEFMVPHG